eukprot:TRINITY_DN10228_c0_g1_i1.p4 TRINITY_DN10228_c0_g1~~TRINITY_DN10228_c0_g1_i1.p4  ORF type:complete len:133 (+),score=42.78 TRINITY_DN10228_c0_g1_i1:1515-1913(+)
MMKFDSGSGIVGTVFAENRIVHRNGERLEKGFFEADNAIAYACIHSFIFVPLHNYKGRKNAVLQLYNKREGGIGKSDIKQLEMLRGVLGQIVENTLELSNALDYVVSAKSSTAFIYEQVSNDTQHEGLVCEV